MRQHLGRLLDFIKRYFRLLQKSPAWPVIKLVLYSAGYFLLTLGLAIYGGLAISSFRRTRRRFKFPHRPLEPVRVDDKHTLKIFNYGGYAFRDMLKAIDEAQECIYLETYIFKSDEIGREFKRRLIAKAKQGVKVYLAFDGFGSLLMPFGFRRWPREVNFTWYGPLYSYLNFLWLGTYIRTHRKILSIDHKVAFLGGMNIGREYATSWRDTHLRIDGPTAREISLAFAELWNKRQFFNPHRRIYLPFRHDPSDDHVLYLRQSRKSRVLGPQHARKTIRDTYLEAFRAARSRILITNPYFLPDKQMEQDLLDAIKRGVRVEILIPERSNHLIVDLLARPVLCRILEAGGVVWLYQKTIIHSKTATIDGLWSTVGSANLDGRSLINHEINLFVNNAEFGRVMEQMWEDDLANCRKANHKDFSQPSRRRLFLEVTLSPLRPYV